MDCGGGGGNRGRTVYDTVRLEYSNVPLVVSSSSCSLLLRLLRRFSLRGHDLSLTDYLHRVFNFSSTAFGGGAPSIEKDTSDQRREICAPAGGRKLRRFTATNNYSRPFFQRRPGILLPDSTAPEPPSSVPRLELLGGRKNSRRTRSSGSFPTNRHGKTCLPSRHRQLVMIAAY